MRNSHNAGASEILQSFLPEAPVGTAQALVQSTYVIVV